MEKTLKDFVIKEGQPRPKFPEFEGIKEIQYATKEEDKAAFLAAADRVIQRHIKTLKSLADK